MNHLENEYTFYNENQEFYERVHKLEKGIAKNESMSQDTLYDKTLIKEKIEFIKNARPEKQSDFNDFNGNGKNIKEKALKKEVKYLMKKLLEEKGKKK